MRRKNRSAELARLRQVNSGGDPSRALERRALEDAERLAERLRRDTGAEAGEQLEVRSVLGWFHWYRYQALPQAEGRVDAAKAAAFLIPCFIAGDDDMPAPLLPMITEAAAGEATQMFRRAQTGRDPELLAQVVSRMRRVLGATPESHPDRAERLSVLAGAFFVRYELRQAPADLDTAIAYGREAVRAAPLHHPRRIAFHGNLWAALRQRFELTGAQADLDAAIAAGREAVRVPPPGLPDRARHLGVLAQDLAKRAGLTRALADFDTAAHTYREAVQAIPADDRVRRAALLHDLGQLLGLRYAQSRSSADLEAAIAAGEEALSILPDGHPHRATVLSGLGVHVRSRSGMGGAALRDAEAAVDIARAALRDTPVGHPDRARSLYLQAVALRVRYKRTRSEEDLEAAVEAMRAAVRALPVNDSGRAEYLHELGIVLRMWASREAGTAADADAAVSTHCAAIRTLPAGHPDHPWYQSVLGQALLALYSRTKSAQVLDDAIVVMRAVVSDMPAGDPNRALALSNLSEALVARLASHHAAPDPEAVRAAWDADRQAVAALWTQVFEDESADVWLRIKAAVNLSGALALSRSDPGRAAEVAEAAVRLLPELAARRLEPGDQRQVLAEFQGLAGSAAAMALDAPRTPRSRPAERALQLLETGRAVQLSQVLDVRSELTDLRSRHPRLAARLTELRTRLDELADESALDGRLRQDRVVPERHRLAGDMAALLAEIRRLDGFASFGLPPLTGELMEAASEGPVVVLNYSYYRSDALIVTGGGVLQVALPLLKPEAVADQYVSYQQAVRDTLTGTTRDERRRAQAALAGVLRWLWDAVAGPVLDALGYRQEPAAAAEWPRLWWASAGPLGRLPLHAAGHHTDPPGDRNRRTVMDRVVSSYTPTVRALRHARELAAGRPPGPARALIVAMPITPGLPRQGRLNFVETEVAKVRSRLPEHVLLRSPGATTGTAATADGTPTKARVLAHLRTCSVAHFACHGDSHPTDPSRSRLLLHDHARDPMTVAALGPLHLEAAQLAYLSACRTADVADPMPADEAVHLASAFQLAGFPHVIGTLWEVDDQVSATIADSFYSHLRSAGNALDTGRSAHALHRAVRMIRDEFPQTPSLWAGHLHTGA
jgi:tetratricopeptide (TPR) repeat protein